MYCGRKYSGSRSKRRRTWLGLFGIERMQLEGACRLFDHCEFSASLFQHAETRQKSGAPVNELGIAGGQLEGSYKMLDHRILSQPISAH